MGIIVLSFDEITKDKANITNNILFEMSRKVTVTYEANKFVLVNFGLAPLGIFLSPKSKKLP